MEGRAVERSQFTFYASFWAALSRIKNKAVRCAAYDAVIAYALHGELPDMEALPDAAAIAFDLIKPTLDAAAKKSAAGKAKSKREQNGIKPESNPNQNGIKTESKRERGGEREREREREGEGDRE